MRRLRNWVLFSVGALLGLATALFIAENRTDVVVEFVAWESEALPLWFVLCVAFVAGAAIPRLLTAGATYRRVRRHMATRQRLADLETEVVRLRNIPLEALPKIQPKADLDADVHGLEEPNEPVPVGPMPDAYEVLLGGRSGSVPAVSGADPYAALFGDAPASQINDAEAAELYPAVIDVSDEGE